MVSLSGCPGAPDANGSSVDLALYNYTAATQPLKLEALRADAETYADAVAFEGEFEVPPPGDGEPAGVVRQSDVVPRRRYLLRALLRNGRGEWDHHHFYPGESSTDPDAARFEVRVYRDEATGEPYTRFR